MAELNFKDDLEIDPDSLDIEWLEQPNLMMEYSEEQDKAVRERDNGKIALDMAKDELEEAKARATLQIRENPDQFGLDKVTDSTVAAGVALHSEVKAAKEKYYKVAEEYNELKEVANNYVSAVKAFEQRKSSLENLTKLLGMQYFSAPNVERNLSEEYAKKKKQKSDNTRKQVRETQKSRRRSK